MKHVRAGVFGIQVCRIDVAGYDRKQFNILESYDARNACAVADTDLVEHTVLDQCDCGCALVHDGLSALQNVKPWRVFQFFVPSLGVAGWRWRCRRG
jgi:hypothetical protein